MADGRLLIADCARDGFADGAGNGAENGKKRAKSLQGLPLRPQSTSCGSGLRVAVFQIKTASGMTV
jgi:hypothetical protein